MSKLTSMKLSESDRKKQMEPSIAYEGPKYPYGLALSLNEEILDKLDLGSLPKVGATLTLVATVDVTSASSEEHQGGKRRSIGLQITEMCLEAEGDAESAAKALYEA